MVQEIQIGESFTLTGLEELHAVLFEDETVDLTENPQNVPRQVLLKNAADEPVGRFTVRFDQAEGDIDLSSMVAAVDSLWHKSILHMDLWPEEIEDAKHLYMPSSGAGKVYIIQDAASLDDVGYSSNWPILSIFHIFLL